MLNYGRFLIGLIVLSLSGSGCFFVSSFQSPEVLPKNQVSLQLGLSGFAAEGGASLPLIPDVAVRYGIGNRMDIGGRLGVGIIGGDIKWQLLPGPLLVSLDLGASVFGVITTDESNSAVVGLYPMLLVGTKNIFAGYRHVYFGGEVEGFDGSSPFSGQFPSFVIGGSLGKQRVRFLPEVVFMFPQGETFISYGISIQYRLGKKNSR